MKDDLNFLHFDLDAFYASVEILDRPSLKNKPLVVGGNHARGIITTASYEARKYGIHSAMPIFQAKKLCPHLIIMPVRFDRYRELSNKVFRLFDKYQVVVEQVGIDEGFLDLSTWDIKPDLFAKILQDEVRMKTGLTISVGISFNKSLAKMASDWNKPNGIKIIEKKEIPDILLPLKVEKIAGVGKRTKEKLHAMDIYTVKDLIEIPEHIMKYHFGVHGQELYHRIRGVDPRPIHPSYDRKSIGSETTFRKDYFRREDLLEALDECIQKIYREISKKQWLYKTIHLKIKYSDFQTMTRSVTLSNYTDNKQEIEEKIHYLIRRIDMKKGVRLVGVSVSNLQHKNHIQLSFLNRT